MYGDLWETGRGGKRGKGGGLGRGDRDLWEMENSGKWGYLGEGKMPGYGGENLIRGVAM